jgi:hypothetical protein
MTPERQNFLRYIGKHLPNYTAEKANVLMPYMAVNFKLTSTESHYLFWVISQRLEQEEHTYASV